MLRKLSLLVFSLWLGMGIGVSFVAIPHVFSPAVREFLPTGVPGQIAQGILLRLFRWQGVLAGLACLLHLLAGLRGPTVNPLVRRLLPALLGLSLAALFWLHPRMVALSVQKNRPELSESARQEAGTAFGRWHGMSMIGNMLILVGVLACWWSLEQNPAQVPLPERNQPSGRD